MSAVVDVAYTLEKMKPAPGETTEQFAKRGLLWQNEVYSANAGSDLGIDWYNITESDRAAWIKWAEGKMK